MRSRSAEAISKSKRRSDAGPSPAIDETVGDAEISDNAPEAVEVEEQPLEVELNLRRAAALRAFGLAGQTARAAADKKEADQLEAEKRRAALLAFGIRRR